MSVTEILGKLNVLPSTSTEDSIFIFTILEVVVPELQRLECTGTNTTDKILDLKHATLVNLDNPRLLLHRVIDILFDQDDQCDQTKPPSDLGKIYQALKLLANLHSACPHVRLILLKFSLLGFADTVDPHGKQGLVHVLEGIAIECNAACLYEAAASAYEHIAESGCLEGVRLMECLDLASSAYFKVYNQRSVFLAKRVLRMAAKVCEPAIFHYYLHHFAFIAHRFGRPDQATILRKQIYKAWASGANSDPAIVYHKARTVFFLNVHQRTGNEVPSIGEAVGELQQLLGRVDTCPEIPDESKPLFKGKVLYLLSRCLKLQGRRDEANQAARQCFQVRSTVPHISKHLLAKTLELVRKTL